jgi:predicted amidohydrolase
MTAVASLALCQIGGAPYDVEANRERSFEVAEEAFARGAKIAVLPELIVPGYGSDATRIGPLAEPLDGPTLEGWTAVYNSAVLVGPGGLLLHYRKLHLFGREKEAFTPGDLGLPVADTPLGRIGLCVCYDLRFVETVRILALRGAELILVPTAWVTGFDQQKWDDSGLAPQAHGALVQANLNQVFVACASQAGAFGDTEFLGSSIVASPRGKLLAGPLGGDRDEMALVDVDLGEARLAQQRGELISPRADRRTDVYAVTVDGESL